MKKVKIINLIILILCVCLFFSILKIFTKKDITKAANTENVEVKAQKFIDKCNELKIITVLKGDIEAQQGSKNGNFTVEYLYEIKDLPMKIENNIPAITLGEFSLKLKQTKTTSKDKWFNTDVWNTVCSDLEYKRKALNNTVKELNKIAGECGLKVRFEIIEGGMMENDLVEIVSSNVK